MKVGGKAVVFTFLLAGIFRNSAEGVTMKTHFKVADLAIMLKKLNNLQRFKYDGGPGYAGEKFGTTFIVKSRLECQVYIREREKRSLNLEE